MICANDVSGGQVLTRMKMPRSFFGKWYKKLSLKSKVELAADLVNEESSNAIKKPYNSNRTFT